MFLKMYIFSYLNAQLIVPSCVGSKWKLNGEKMDLDNKKNHVNQSNGQKNVQLDWLLA